MRPSSAKRPVSRPLEAFKRPSSATRPVARPRFETQIKRKISTSVEDETIDFLKLKIRSLQNRNSTLATELATFENRAEELLYENLSLKRPSHEVEAPLVKEREHPMHLKLRDLERQVSSLQENLEGLEMQTIERPVLYWPKILDALAAVNGHLNAFQTAVDEVALHAIVSEKLRQQCRLDRKRIIKKIALLALQTRGLHLFLLAGKPL